MEQDEPGTDDFAQERDLGMGLDDSSGYLTGNDDNSPDTPDVFQGEGDEGKIAPAKPRTSDSDS